MKNYYHILGILESASQIEIKRSFKRLALDCHPDRNPGNKKAEERFKEINEAYQLLSDPTKKNQYDSRLSYERFAKRYSALYDPPHSHRFRRRATKSRSYRATDFNHKKRELRNTLIAFVIMGILGAITFGTTGAISYYENRIEQEALLKYGQITGRAQQHYNQGKFTLALASIDSVPTEYTYKLDYHFFRDKVLKDLKKRAIRRFNGNLFMEASEDYSGLRKYSRFFEAQSKRNLAICFKELGDYKNASMMLEELVILNPFSIRLCLDVAGMNRIELNNLDKAIEYYEKGSDMAIRFYESIYGKAFYILVQPRRTPKIHFELFYYKALAYYSKGEHLQARYAINWACFLKPESGEGMTLKGQIYQALGNRNEACEHWQKAVELGDDKGKQFREEYCGV